MAVLEPGRLRRPQENDIAFFEREIDSFLPDKVFDAHTHAWRRSEVPNWDSYEDVWLSRQRSSVKRRCWSVTDGTEATILVGSDSSSKFFW